MKRSALGCLGWTLLLAAGARTQEGPCAHWPFERAEPPSARDIAGGVEDAIGGLARFAPGVRGTALHLDGLTTEIVRPGERAPRLDGALSVDAWVALAAYPWNFCPVLSQRRDEETGYALQLGPRGELRLELAAGAGWVRCTSASGAVPLRRWVHVAGVYDPARGLALYLDGEPLVRAEASGALRPAADVELRIGADHAPAKPAHIHREHGTLASWWSLDGLLDELRLHARALSDTEIRAAFAACAPPPVAALAPRRLPAGPPGPGRFGAVYTRLRYDEGWDALWRVGDDPDVLVRFDRSPARVVFWRGTRYSPAWVSENELWMADQSLEAWEHGAADAEGCFEHMQDRRCRYSHVRVIESHAARVVVHWRYALVSAHNNLWREDPRTGRACWVDEYYTIYPDAVGVRKVCWQAGTLGPRRQFQESLPFTQPGQWTDEVVEREFCHVGNLAGEVTALAFVEKPEKTKPGLPAELCMQQYRFKSAWKPFIVFEEGTRMQYVQDRNLRGYRRPGACNHWPVGQPACDGRTSQAVDRPTHFLGFPISYPPVHTGNGRCWWNGLYGMSAGTLAELLPLALSWNRPAALTVVQGAFSARDYDRGQRAYLVERTGAGTSLKLTLAPLSGEPIHNPALVISGWGTAGARIRVDGVPRPTGAGLCLGHRHRLGGSDLVLWLDLDSSAPLTLLIEEE